MPLRRNHTAKQTCGGPTMALRWSWGGIRFLACLGCLENRTVASRHPCGGLTSPLRRLHSMLVVAATTIRVPYGHRTVASRFPCGNLAFFIFWKYDRRAVTVKFATTTTVARKTIRFWKSHFTNHRPQNRTATVRWQHDMWPRHNTD